MKLPGLIAFLVLTLATIAPAADFKTSAAPAFTLLDTRIISQQPETYCGWPTVARRTPCCGRLGGKFPRCDEPQPNRRRMTPSPTASA